MSQSIQGATIITGSANIRAAQLCAVRGALRLEMLGMRHSRGSVAAMWRKHYGMRPRAPIADVLARVNEELAALHRGMGIE